MNPNIEELLARANKQLDSGSALEAKQTFENVLGHEESNIEALLMLAAINGELGNHKEAVKYCEKILAKDNECVEAHFMLGQFYLQSENFTQAIDCFRYAVNIEPEFGEAWGMLARLSGQSGHYEEAKEFCEEAIKYFPESYEYHVNLTYAHIGLEQFKDASQSAAKATELNSTSSDAWLAKALADEKNRDYIHANVGYQKSIALNQNNINAILGYARILGHENKLNDAEKIIVEAISMHQSETTLKIALAGIFEKQNKLHDAKSTYQNILKNDPKNSTALTNLGNIKLSHGDISTAEELYKQAIKYNSNSAEAYYNYGVLKNRQSEYNEAEELFNKAISIRTNFPEAHWDIAFVYLLKGDFARGWEKYEWRKRHNKYIRRSFKRTEWKGSSLDGKTILVHDEQGFGDTFQFVRYLQLLKSNKIKVIFECHRGLKQVLQGFSGYDEIYERNPNGQPPNAHYDTHVHLMSLPNIYKTNIDTIPARTPYIFADKQLTAKWHTNLANDPAFKIGLCWAGSSKHTNEGNRSCPLANFAPLQDIPGINFYSLQKDIISKNDALSLVSFKNLDQEAPFTDTAALMMNLDLIITIDTSIAHLAGALGRPVWTLLCTSPDWRWQLTGNSSPWYPTMKLFRQSEKNNWKSVIRDIKKELLDLIALK